MEQYYNTNHLKGETLERAIESNLTQEEKIVYIFSIQKKPMSASMVYHYFNDTRVPLTSVRRAMTNLMNQSRLRKSEKMVTGIYGKPEHLYFLPVVIQ